MAAMNQPIDSFEELKYRGPDGWEPLPAWARFLLEAGAAVATHRAGDGRLVVAVSVPTRAFAAALAGASAVVSAFVADPALLDGAEHFQHLSSLPPGTAVTLRTGNSIEQGTLLGVNYDAAPGDPRPRLKVQLAKMISYLDERGCDRIQVINDPGELGTRRRKLVRAPEFLSRAVAGVDVQVLSATTRLDCVVVGVLTALQHELKDELFAAGDDGASHEGSLQSILRTKQLGGTNDHYRSAVIPSSAEAGEARPDGSPAAVIFDGSAAFNNWRSFWPDSNWLVILDRSSPSAEDGAAAIANSFSRRLRECDVLSTSDVPAGVEMVAYVERQ
jgi:hypothetical protein